MFLLMAVCLGLSLFPSDSAWTHGEESPVGDLLKTLEVGEPVHYENLTIIPIYSTKIKDHTRYVTLEEAFKKGWIEVKELSGGRVPQLKLTNKSSKHIFILGGEVLTGCKQDRLVGRDVLVAPRRKDLTIPVYCVEQGRWTYNTNKFYSKGNLGLPELRARAQSKSSAAQSGIWSAIKKSNQRLGVTSRSSNYQDAYEKEEVRKGIASYQKKFEQVPQLYPDTVGVLVGVGGQIRNVDIFANRYLFQKLWPKILKSSSLAALNVRGSGSITQEEAVSFLRSLGSKHYTKNQAVDLGVEYSSIDKDLNVNALAYRNVTIHLSAFPQEGKVGVKGDDQPERRIPVIRR